MIFYLLLTIFVVIVLSSFCSLVETALFTVPINKVKAWVVKGRKSADYLLQIKESIDSPIATIVVLNNISNIVGSLIVGGILANLFNDLWIGIVSACFTLLIILFSEIIPKVLGERFADVISLYFAHTMLVITRIFSPLLYIILFITGPFRRIQRSTKISEEEIRVLANLGREQGILENEEKAIIEKALKLNDIRVKDIMTPRIKMRGLKEDLLLKEVRDNLLDEKHSHIPLFKENIDSITGILSKSDALKAICEGKINVSLSRLSDKVLFVPESKTLDKLMEYLRVTQAHTAIVVDEYGGTAGLVTLGDLLEELVGDVAGYDAYEIDKEKTSIKACLSKNEILVYGTTFIEDINEYFGTDIQEHRTVSKLILEHFRRFPTSGEEMELGGLEFSVEEVTSKTIETVKVRRLS